MSMSFFPAMPQWTTPFFGSRPPCSSVEDRKQQDYIGTAEYKRFIKVRGDRLFFL